MGISKIRTLSNGIEMPTLGLGVYKVPPEEAERTVRHALDIGYRHIDTASYYENEKGVGRAILSSSVKRDDIFVTTKVWNDEQGYDQTLQAFERSLKNLGFDYVDLYLIHWPLPNKMAETWKALERLYDEGLVKAIGVSNFLKHHLEQLYQTAQVKPMVNQIECHPKLVQTETIEFCQQEGIVHQSWSPIGRAKYLDEPLLVRLAEKYQKSTAQIMIRWHLQRDFVVLPKSVHKERQLENISVFDFSLTEEEMDQINRLNVGLRVGSHPDEMAQRYR